MANDMKIKCPSNRHDTERKALPSTFVTVGLVKPVIGGKKVKTVKAFIQHYLADGTLGTPSEKEKTRQLRPANPRYLQWAILFKQAGAAATVRVKLTVEAYEKGNANAIASTSVDLWLKPNSRPVAPTIDWPETDGYTIEGSERDSFICFGTSELPVTSLTLDGTPSVGYDWYDTEDFWWGEFSPGSDPGTGTGYVILATNADGSNQRLVDVASS